jgi:hypothetical protein
MVKDFKYNYREALCLFQHPPQHITLFTVSVRADTPSIRFLHFPSSDDSISEPQGPHSSSSPGPRYLQTTHTARSIRNTASWTIMVSKKGSLLVALMLVGQSAAFALPDLSHLFRRAPFSVSRYASLGESFASGPSAGDPYDQVTKCRRYKEAQGPQVAADGRIQGPKPIKFDFIACSGSKIKNIWQDSTGGGDGPAAKPKIAQAKALKDTNPDLVTMSIGGNDVGFVDLLDRVSKFRTDATMVDEGSQG